MDLNLIHKQLSMHQMHIMGISSDDDDYDDDDDDDDDDVHLFVYSKHAR